MWVCIGIDNSFEPFVCSIFYKKSIGSWSKRESLNLYSKLPGNVFNIDRKRDRPIGCYGFI